RYQRLAHVRKLIAEGVMTSDLRLVEVPNGRSLNNQPHDQAPDDHRHSIPNPNQKESVRAHDCIAGGQSRGVPVPLVWHSRVSTGTRSGRYRSGWPAPSAWSSALPGAQIFPTDRVLTRLLAAADHGHGAARRGVPPGVCLLLLLLGNTAGARAAQCGTT